MALAITACQQGFALDCTTLDDLVQQLKTAEPRHPWQPQLKTSLKAALFGLDEVGSLPLDRMAANDRCQLIGRRDERGSLIVTSNQAFSAWAALFGDAVLAAAILDRWLPHAEVLPSNGPSSRLKDRLTVGRVGTMARTS